MKKITLTFCLFATSFCVSAATFYDQLCAFNYNWKKYALIAPKGEARVFSTDAEYVQAHLGSVIPILRAANTDQLTPELRANRATLINLLDGYRIAGRFPLNHYRTERIPVFIDEHGTHCAVGYLMMMSGHEALAQRISAADNYVWVKDLKDPEALAWQASSGFALEELKLIQGAYDWYPPNAWVSPDKYETPQMPICTTAYFEANYNGAVNLKKEDRVWCNGEGSGKVINGKWEQNYGPGQPWIKGYFINGQRSGDWEEYYPGTQTLCRTESWRHNKLNGVRKRFDRESRLIEEITFVEGEAVCKTNYDLYDSLAYVRIPQDSNIVLTKVFDRTGKLIATGFEQIYNPAGLLWFQNIELTAMNAIQVSARSAIQDPGQSNSNFGHDGGYDTGANGSSLSYRSLFQPGAFQPELVRYHKIGRWIYLPYESQLYARYKGANRLWYMYFGEFGSQLYNSTAMFRDQLTSPSYDSISVEYNVNQIEHFIGYRTDMIYTHICFTYYPPEQNLPYENSILLFAYAGNDPSNLSLKSAGMYNTFGERIGEWKYFNTSGQMTRTENYLIPMKEEEDTEGKKFASK